ncbi:MAG TPA: helix-hairpin-helix domain-containing protein [Bryobacteraceae bacterium]|jgi:competence ComEA-like helix-hairpin-helix protein|nr:helix-hairpin-helix domain-containing protein [Bryobacteraceae bacterium]
MYHQRLFVPVGVTFGLILGGAAWAQTGPELPEGKGKAQFTQICSHCHGLEMVTKHRNTSDGWSAVVDDMVSRGAQGTDDDFDLVVAYLSAHFGPKINVNKANESELSTALGITSADADAIVHYRETAGEIKDWSDLEKVPHIDIKKLENQKDRIEFSASAGQSK